MNLDFEKRLWNKGYEYVFGLDEVGRGPLAGPVVTCCVFVKPNIDISDDFLNKVKDSKKISHKKRELILEELKTIPGIEYAICKIEPEEIDKINILKATLKSFKNSTLLLEKKINHKPNILLIDGNKTIPDFEYMQESIIQGDSKVFSIALASIIAKEYRDKIMIKCADKYPNYLFENNKGYGTKDHICSIKKFGICEIHRKTFIKNFK